MKVKKGDRVKIVENHSGHHFAIGTIVEIRSTGKCNLSAWEPDHIHMNHGFGGFWWISKNDIAPAKAKVI